MRITEINSNSWYVFSDPSKPSKVTKRKEGDRYRATCVCRVFRDIGTCSHVKTIKEQYKNANWIEDKLEQLPEYLGGDDRGQIRELLKRLTY